MDDTQRAAARAQIGRTATAASTQDAGRKADPRSIRAAAPVTKSAAAQPLELIPPETEVSFVNWKVGARRPSRRYATAEFAFAEARRLRTLDPGSTIYTYRLSLVREARSP